METDFCDFTGMLLSRKANLLHEVDKNIFAGPSGRPVYGRSSAENVCSNPTGGMDVCCDCCVLSGRGLCDTLIMRPDESYR